MYITTIANRNSPPAVLLRESYREQGQVKSRTLANLSKWPQAKIDALRRVLADEPMQPTATQRFEIERALGYGHVAAALGTLRRIGLEQILPRRPDRLGRLITAMIVARVVEPAAKLATARQLSDATASHALGALLGLGEVDADELYAALDRLQAAQPEIEQALAKPHLKDGVLVLYDVSSSYLEGEHCELAQRGYSRDHRPDRRQIVYGLLCNQLGCPVAVDVFEGNTADPMTLASQITKLRTRFNLSRVVLVGDRGMITDARLEADVKPAGLDWITALRAPSIRELAAEGGPLQLSLFDQRDMAEITSDEYPGERLVVCRNPDLAARRSHKRQELLDATEHRLAAVATRLRHKRRRLRGAAKIGIAVGAVLNKHKMAKHFDVVIGNTTLAWSRKQDTIAAEAALDGFYVIRTSLPAEVCATDQLVLAYKGLSQVERAFRSLKTTDLEIRPIHHRRARRVRGHVLLCMLAYYVTWHMQQALAPMLFTDHDRQAAAGQRASPVAAARVSPAARAKAATKRTADGQPVHSFATLLADLANLTRNTVRFAKALPVTVLSRPTTVQQRAFQLLGLKHAA
ncbi:MAG: IS1634 family transposase [Steroidobacteraceae bacterium]